MKRTPNCSFSEVTLDESKHGTTRADVYTFLHIYAMEFKIKVHINAYNLICIPSTIGLNACKHSRLSLTFVDGAISENVLIDCISSITSLRFPHHLRLFLMKVFYKLFSP